MSASEDCQCIDDDRMVLAEVDGWRCHDCGLLLTRGAMSA